MSSKPTVIFVPGAWHTPESFALVAAHLKDAGYEYTDVDKPSVSLSAPYIQSFEPDVEAVRKEVLAASDAGNDVVLVMHSYGGIPGSAAAKGLSKEDREKEGKKGGIIGLVYISSFAIEEGQSLISAAGGELSPWCIVEVCTLFPHP
jgi:pimeloyl-ACP methyl ester carboxylesterase